MRVVGGSGTGAEAGLSGDRALLRLQRAIPTSMPQFS